LWLLAAAAVVKVTMPGAVAVLVDF